MFQFVTDKVCMKVAMSHRRFWCATPVDRSVVSFRRYRRLLHGIVWYGMVLHGAAWYCL